MDVGLIDFEDLSSGFVVDGCLAAVAIFDLAVVDGCLAAVAKFDLAMAASYVIEYSVAVVVIVVDGSYD